MSVSSFNWGCLFISTVKLISSTLQSAGGLLYPGNMSPVGLLYRSVAAHGNPGLIGVDLICEKKKCIYHH